MRLFICIQRAEWKQMVEKQLCFWKKQIWNS